MVPRLRPRIDFAEMQDDGSDEDEDDEEGPCFPTEAAVAPPATEEEGDALDAGTDLRRLLAECGDTSLGHLPSDALLDFLWRHDLRPSEAVALQTSTCSTRIERLCGSASEVRRATHAYLASLPDATIMETHRKLLHDPPSDLQALLVTDGESSARAILLMQRSKRRGRIDLVHVHPRHRGRGYARRLAEEAKRCAPPGATLTVDSPWCTARAAVHIWFGAGFMCSADLLSSSLRDDAAYERDTNRSVRLTFSWRQGETAEDAEERLRFYRAAARVHPELIRYCSSSSSASS